jgi:GTP cyclohydrolase II
MIGQHSPSIQPFSSTKLPTSLGDFDVTVYRGPEGEEHLAISTGLSSRTHDLGAPLVRIHSACFTSEVLSSLKCDCREQLDYALKAIKEEGCGLVVYLFQEGRGIGLGAKIQVYALQEQGHDTVEANTELGFDEDARTYEAAIEILKDLKLYKLRLLTNNPEKVEALASTGLFNVERVPIEVGRNPVNHEYLRVKRDKMGHLLKDMPQ